MLSRSEQLPLDIGARLKPRKLNDAESGAANLALLSRLRSSSLRFGQYLRGTAGTLSLAAAVFLVVAGIGVAASYVNGPSGVTDSGDASDGALLARLDDYTRSLSHEQPASAAAPDNLLPDVNTMTERLAARLETNPDDVNGWRTLGWSYFNIGSFEQAAAAYAKAIELDPSSAEIKASYEEAKAKASESNNQATAAPLQAGAVGEGGDGPSAEKATGSDVAPPHTSEAAIRSMVDGLANRLESSPRDVEGWTRLMRSRVVLGEREVAVAAFQKALEVFKDDSAASAEITAAAIDLGLKVE
jgi:cytochrome c-type biogenesis protein CcmH